MKLKINIILLAMVMAADLFAATPLRNASPIMAGGKDGLAPMSFGRTYANCPVGCAYLSSKTRPDVFVAVTSGTADALGLWWCRYDCDTPQGNSIYKDPVLVSSPFEDPVKHRPSGNIRVFQDGGSTWLIQVTGKSINTALWNGKDAFEKAYSTSWPGASHIADFDIIRRTPDSVEIVLVCTEEGSYRPETFNGDRQSLYDGAEVFRGKLLNGGLVHFMVDNSWNIIGDVESLTEKNLAINASRVACVSDKGIDGYIITNSLGAMKFVACGSDHAIHVMKDGKYVRTHPAHGAWAVSYPAGGSRLVIGGESAMYTYDFQKMTDKGAPIYADPLPVLQKKAPLYGGSLTVPNVVDWDGDGVLDIVAGNSEGRLLFFKNSGSDRKPDFAYPQEVCSDGKPICIRPGYHIVQGPLEGAWGYLCPTVFDWNQDGLPDVIVSGSIDRYLVMLNKGTLQHPELGAPEPIRIDNMELFGTWRVRPAIGKVGDEILMVILDDLNSLHMFRKVDDYTVEDVRRLTLTDGNIITGHNDRPQDNLGQMGRAKMQFVDWDGDGDLDLFVGTVRRNAYPDPHNGLPYRRWRDEKVAAMDVLLFINTGDFVFEYPVQMQVDGEDFYMGAHSNAPFACPLGDTSDGLNLVVGCETGKYFFFERKHLTTIK